MGKPLGPRKLKRLVEYAALHGVVARYNQRRGIFELTPGPFIKADSVPKECPASLEGLVKAFEGTKPSGS